MPNSVPARKTRTAISPRLAHMIFSSFPLLDRKIFPKPESALTSFLSAAGSEIARDRGARGPRREEDVKTFLAAAAAVMCFPDEEEPRDAAREESGDAAAPLAEDAAGIALVKRVTGVVPANTAAEHDITTRTWC
jgi:hypothetical protein